MDDRIQCSLELVRMEIYCTSGSAVAFDLFATMKCKQDITHSKTHELQIATLEMAYTQKYPAPIEL